MKIKIYKNKYYKNNNRKIVILYSIVDLLRNITTNGSLNQFEKDLKKLDLLFSLADEKNL